MWKRVQRGAAAGARAIFCCIGGRSSAADNVATEATPLNAASRERDELVLREPRYVLDKSSVTNT